MGVSARVFACACAYTDEHVCARGQGVCDPLALTKCVSWAQGFGGHTAVHGEVEWLLHFGPNDSVRKRRKALASEEAGLAAAPHPVAVWRSHLGVSKAPSMQGVHSQNPQP